MVSLFATPFRPAPGRLLVGLSHVLLSSGLSVAIARSVSAQAVAGVGADAAPVPRGSVRIRIGGVWDQFNRTFQEDSATPIRASLTTPAFGVRQMPQLSAAQSAIRTLAGNSTFALSLGTLEASGDARSVTTPLSLDVGVTPRISIGLLVPYVESRNNALLVLNRDGASASVGQNPAFTAGTGAAARTANGTLLRQLAQARALLSSEITRCAVEVATNCDAIRANPAAAAAAVQQALETQSALVAVYGDSLRGGAPVVPISGSATQLAINSRISSLRTAFAAFGITNIAATSLPQPAVIVNGPGAISRIANDSAYGLNYTTLGGTRRAGLGDIDMTASFLWLNTLGSRPAEWLAATKFGVRSQVTAGWRFGTAGADRTEDAFDLPIGDGANALLLRSTSDMVLNKRFWISGTLRLVQPMGDNVMIRRPLFADSALFMSSTTERATRTLGRRAELEIAPRVVIGQFFGVSGGYLYRRADADVFAFGAADAAQAATLSLPTRTYQAYMVGFTFSTLASYVRGRSMLPVEVFYTHAAPLTGAGGAPAMSTDRLELRVYTGFPRR